MHKSRRRRQPGVVTWPKACGRWSISAGLLFTACREPTSVADLGGTIVGSEQVSTPEPVSPAQPSHELPVAPLSNQPAAAGDCTKLRSDPALGIMVVPQQPRVGDVVRVVAASLRDEEPLAIRVDQGNAALDLVAQVLPGTPTTVTATWSATAVGKVAVLVGRNGQAMGCTKVNVRPAHHKVLPVPAPRADGWPWLPTAAWDDGQEALFSAWVALLFTGDLERDLAFLNLEEVVRQPARNWLHNALGWQEDGERALRLRPDCADTPYFLRAYFAWKQGLPFGFYSCSRGSAKSAPRCRELHSAHEPASGDRPNALSQLDLVQHFFRKSLAWGVHTGNGRVAHGDPVSELYPVALSRRAIRPGTIYADPYGHILVVTQWVPAHGESPGLLLAIDGQPDDSITRKRFWEGNFLYNPDPKLGGTGFKGFRPPRWQSPEAGEVGSALGRLVFADDASLHKREMLGGVLPPGPMVDAVAFYDRMDALMTPQGREPLRALTQAVQALAEQARVRVTSVENGRKWQLAQPQVVAVMPDGFAIFETTGTWEDYSTPARDLRLLVAMDVVMGFESKIRRNPAAFGLAEPALVEQAVQAVTALRSKLLDDPTYAITYTRSDGSPWTLTLAQLIARQAAFEMAYNPNACVEARWGAASESEERHPCNRTIPSDQMAKMQSYRPWFHTRTRPVRGQMRPE